VKTRDLTVLEQIIARKRAELLAQRTLVKPEMLKVRERPARRPFRSALKAKSPAIISEIKKASPSAGVITEKFEPAAIAERYESAGAAALSVLTDQQFFQGSLEYLAAARNATNLPVLRKDFTLDRYHLLEAAAWGADAVLLIVAALSDEKLRELVAQSEELNLEVLVEVHNEAELERALSAEANWIGVNNRNLKTLEVSLETSLLLAELIPSDVFWISESGIRSPEEIRQLMDAGCDGFLVGESLMKKDDPGQALSELIQGARTGGS
jgi:indole-3-glycerol phosphate synthase